MRHTPKRLAAVGFLAAAGLVLAGCAGSEPKSSEPSGSDDSPTIVMARVSGDPFYTTLECAALDAAEKLGVDLKVQGIPNYEVAEQTRVLNTVLSTKPDVILTAPVDPDGMIPVFQAAKDQGIGMVTFDTTLGDGSLVDSAIITDNTDQGRLAADALAEAIGKKGKVVVLSDTPGVTTTEAEQRGFEERISDYPNIEYLGTEFHNNDQNKAVSVLSAVLSRDSDLAGIFTTNTFGSQAAATAVRQAGRVGDIKIIAYDTSQEILDGLEEGVFTAVIAYEARNEGALAVEAAVKIAKGESVDKVYQVENAVITKENLAELGPKFVYVESCG